MTTQTTARTTAAQFRAMCLAFLGPHRAQDCAEWSVSYLATTVSHLGPQGYALACIGWEVRS